MRRELYPEVDFSRRDPRGLPLSEGVSCSKITTGPWLSRNSIHSKFPDQAEVRISGLGFLSLRFERGPLEVSTTPDDDDDSLTLT